MKVYIVNQITYIKKPTKVHSYRKRFFATLDDANKHIDFELKYYKSMNDDGVCKKSQSIASYENNDLRVEFTIGSENVDPDG